MQELNIIDLGIADYSSCLSRQLDMVAQRQQGKIGNTVIIVQHPDVITLGAREDKNRLCAELDQLEKNNIELISVRRGGGATAHNPGQLVFYPIVDIRSLGFSVSDYVRTLEQIGMDLLSGFGVKADRKKGLPGLWIDDRKIASIGVKLKKWVSYHGMAVNINNDLEIFKWIVPCGLDGVVMTSASQQLNRDIDLSEVKTSLSRILQKHLV